MKIKLLPLALAALALVSCGGNSGSSTADSSIDSDASVKTWTWLDFLQNDKTFRFDLFDIAEGIQFNYGNNAVTASGTILTMDDNARIGVNKNTETDMVFNAIIVVEKSTGAHYASVTKGLDSTRLTEVLGLLGDDLSGYDRGYVSFSMGNTAKWTQGLNSDLDTYIRARI